MPKIPFWIFIVIALVYFTAIRVDTMDIDASQYAGMSSEMLHSHNWLQLYDHGLDYLDKPPLLIWVSALSMKVFGVNNFGYKLPSILFALWALFATYKLSKLLYNEHTARLASLILATCQGMFLMTNDVRCDTILMSWVVTGIWMIKEWDVSKKYKYLYLGFAAIGMGMMTKGPIALMVPVFCFATDFALKRNWKRFIDPAYLLGIVIIAVLLLPMSIGLYTQFDLHPEKVVNGNTGVSGLRFFYWSQSFGRITGESPWKNGADISFLLLNMLWSFLPWIFVLLPAIAIQFIVLVRQKFRLRADQEFITTGGFVLAYLALGSSAYQLPHYIFVAFPLAAIICAQSMAGFIESGAFKGVYRVLQPWLISITVLVLGLVLLLITWVFPSGILAIVLWGAGIILWLAIAFNKRITRKLFWLPALGMIIANVFLTNYVYYTLLNYQVGSQVGKFIAHEHIPPNDFYSLKMRDPLNSLNFYSDERLTRIDTSDEIKARKYILTMDEGMEEIKRLGFRYTIVKQGELFKVSELTPEFLNPKTRPQALKKYYLVKMQ